MNDEIAPRGLIMTHEAFLSGTAPNRTISIGDQPNPFKIYRNIEPSFNSDLS